MREQITKSQPEGGNTSSKWPTIVLWRVLLLRVSYRVSAKYHGNCRRTTPAVKPRLLLPWGSTLVVTRGGDTCQSGLWLEPVWQVFYSWATTCGHYSKAGRSLGSSIQTLWPGILRDCLWQGSEIQADQEGITDTSSCSCREQPPPALSWAKDSEGKCFLWCRAPDSETQHVLCSPQRVTLKQKLQMFKQTGTNAALHQSKGSSHSRTEIPNARHKIYPASTTTSPLEKIHTLMINGPQTLQKKSEGKRHLHLLGHPCHTDHCNLRCCNKQIVLTKLLRHLTRQTSRKTQQDHLSTPQLSHAHQTLPKPLIGSWCWKAVKISALTRNATLLNWRSFKPLYSCTSPQAAEGPGHCFQAVPLFH